MGQAGPARACTSGQWQWPSLASASGGHGRWAGRIGTTTVYTSTAPPYPPLSPLGRSELLTRIRKIENYQREQIRVLEWGMSPRGTFPTSPCARSSWACYGHDLQRTPQCCGCSQASLPVPMPEGSNSTLPCSMPPPGLGTPSWPTTFDHRATAKVDIIVSTSAWVILVIDVVVCGMDAALYSRHPHQWARHR